MLVRVILIVQDAELEQRLDRAFEPIDSAVATPPRDAVFWDRLMAFPGDLVVIDRASLPEPIENSIATILALPDRPEVIVVQGAEDGEGQAELLIAGCSGFIDASLSDDVLCEVCNAFVDRFRARGIARLQHEIDAPEPQLSDFESTGPTMTSFLRIVRRVVEPDSSLLIQGETGVGKERLARAIHAASPRSSRPFVPVILSAFPETLVESELFGHERGAFTGAVAPRRGCFELAHGGTIFLDEIGELPRHVQVKLLRVLQERCIQRLGGEQSVDVDVRIMAATNRDLLSEVDAQTFRRDLYYRLSVVTLEIPPLREHPEDVARLADRYLEEFRVRLKRDVAGFSDEAMGAMERYRWPGNIRELINIVERAVLLCDHEQVTLQDLPDVLVHGDTGESRSPGSPAARALPESWRSMPWKTVRDTLVAACELDYFRNHLAETSGNVEETARRGGINPRSLYDVMKRHGLRKEDFRTSGDRGRERSRNRE